MSATAPRVAPVVVYSGLAPVILTAVFEDKLTADEINSDPYSAIDRFVSTIAPGVAFGAHVMVLYRHRGGFSVRSDMLYAVQKWIRDEGMFRPSNPAEDDFLDGLGMAFTELSAPDVAVNTQKVVNDPHLRRMVVLTKSAGIIGIVMVAGNAKAYTDWMSPEFAGILAGFTGELVVHSDHEGEES